MTEILNKSKKTIRQEFADTVLEIGKLDKNLVVLVADISHYLLQPFANACPGRYYNIGICEPTMVNMAAGLARTGLIPVMHTIAPFLIERSFEQIKIDFGYQKLPGIFVSVGSAFDYGALGCTHHCYDDFALLKNVEGMQIMFPASCKEFNLLFKQAYNKCLPTYFRLPEQSHDMDFEDKDIILGKGIVVKEGKNLTIFVVGSQLKMVMNSLDELKKHNFDPEIIYFPTIKPLDENLVIASLSKTKKCLIIEEHSQYGGISEDILRCSKNIPLVKYAFINLGDKFVRKYGTYEQQCKDLGFSSGNILKKATELLI